MASLTTLEKQSFEERIFSFDFAAKMESDATITGITSVISENLGQVQGSTNVTISGEVAGGQQVQAKFSGGTTGEKYKITCKCQDSDGQKLELEGFLKVKDI